MFKHLFSNRLFIGAVAFFVLCVGGSLLYMQSVKQQTAREMAGTEERIKQLTEKQNPTAKVPEGDTSQGGHFHEDGTWHAEPHAPISESVTPTDKERTAAPAEQNVLPSTTEYPKRRRWLREGEVKPGHFHSFDHDGYLVCDENGELIQIPYGDPAFDIFTVIGFRPTYEEYQEYRKLRDRMNEAYSSGNMDEYRHLNAESSRFRQEHQGELPDLTATTVFPDDHTPATPAANARFDRLVSEKKVQLYREWGLGYLLEN